MSVNIQGNLPAQVAGAPTQGGAYNSSNLAYRGFLGDIFNGTSIALEDYEREQALMDKANAFNANEAQKQRDFEERLSNTAYQRAVADMKNAGLNPLLAVSNGGASTPAGVSATSAHASGYKGAVSNSSGLIQLIASIAQLGAGLYKAGVNNATKLAVANTVRKSESYSQNWNYNKNIGGKR